MVDDSSDFEDVAIPNEFFIDLLPRIDDLAELKITLFVIQLAQRRRGPGVALEDLLVAPLLRAIVGMSSPEPAEGRLRRIVDRAVANGTLLRVTMHTAELSRQMLLASTRANRLLVERLRAGEPEAARRLEVPLEAEAAIYRPNIFTLYEQHIGPLTPLVAEQLRDAERSYPRAWIEEAIREAEHYGRRNWRYVQTILSNWDATGGQSRTGQHRL